MNNLLSYKKKFYTLMELTLGNVKPLLAEEEECIGGTKPEIINTILDKLSSYGVVYLKRHEVSQCGDPNKPETLGGRFPIGRGSDVYIAVNSYYENGKMYYKLWWKVCDGKTDESRQFTTNQNDLISDYNNSVVPCIFQNKIDLKMSNLQSEDDITI